MTRFTGHVVEYLCTPCSKRKRRDTAPLPAAERYLSRRIRFVADESRRLNAPLLILSGRYGLIDSEEPIPWYDQELLTEAVTGTVPGLTQQLARRRASAVVFYARPRSTPGWKPYYDALERACRAKQVRLRIETLANRFI